MGTGTGIFNYYGLGPPWGRYEPDPIPKGFGNWSKDAQHQWRDEHSYPPTPGQWMMLLFSWSVKETTGTSETRKANGCTKA